VLAGPVLTGLLLTGLLFAGLAGGIVNSLMTWQDGTRAQEPSNHRRAGHLNFLLLVWPRPVPCGAPAAQNSTDMKVPTSVKPTRR